MKMNDKGFSLIQVLISSGMLGAAAVVGIKMMTMQGKMAESTNQKYEMAYIHEEIWRSLQNPESCEATFAGKSLSEWKARGISAISTVYFQSKRKRILKIYKTFNSGFSFYGVGNLKIKDYVLERDNDTLSPQMNLTINFDKGKDSVGGKFVGKKIPLVFSTLDGKIQSCNALPLRDVNVDDEEEASTKSIVQNLKLKLNTSMGLDEEVSVPLSINGTLSLMENNFLECSRKTKGAIRFNSLAQSFELCNGTAPWKTWGKNKLDWTKYVRVIVSPNSKENSPVGNFRFCALGGIENLSPSSCKLITGSTNYSMKRDWVIEKARVKNNTGSCNFLCFD